VETYLLRRWNFAANKQHNGSVRTDFKVWQNGRLVPVDSFPVLTGDSAGDSSSAQHSTNTEAASTPRSSMSYIAAVAVAEPTPHPIAVNKDDIMAAIGPLIKLAEMGKAADHAAAATLDQWVHDNTCIELKQLLSYWGVPMASKNDVTTCEVSKTCMYEAVLLRLGSLHQQQVAL
jgi:hypothetical protein